MQLVTVWRHSNFKTLNKPYKDKERQTSFELWGLTFKIMATDKKGFILYSDLIHTIEKMPSNKAGELFLHILKYVNDQNPVAKDILIDIAFEPIKQSLKRDLIKYEDKRKQWSEAGKKSAEARALAKINEGQQTSTDVESRSTVSTVNDNVNVNVIQKRILSEIKISEVPIDLQLYFKIAKDFQNLFIKNLNQRNAPIKNQQNATFKNYVDPIRLAITNNECTINDFRDVWQYLDSPQGDFWKTNILSTSTLRKQIQKLVMSARENKKQLKKTDKL